MIYSFKTWSKVIKKRIRGSSRSDQCLSMLQAIKNWSITVTGVVITHRNMSYKILTSELGFTYRRKAGDSSTSCKARIKRKISVRSSLTQASFYLISKPCKSSCTRAKRQHSLTDLRAKVCLSTTKWVQYILQRRLCNSMKIRENFSLSLCSNCPLQVVKITNTCLKPCRQTSKAARSH